MANTQAAAQAEISIQSRPTTPFAVGTAGIGADLDYVSAHTYLVRQILAMVAGSHLVQVVAVSNAGGVAPVGSVDVTVLVNQIDGLGNGTPHGTIHGLPYQRVQGGGNAVICDPSVGDIGVAVFADRDISVVKKTRARANPGSRRQNDMADGIYLGYCLGSAPPTQYVRFSDSGIEICAPTQVTLTTPSVRTSGNLAVATGATGSFTTADGQTVTVQDGIIINLY